MGMERVFHALGERNRLRIVLILERGPLSVGEIASVLGLSQSNTSHHLKHLSDAGLVNRRGGRGWVFYSLNRADPLIAGAVRLAAEARPSLPSSSTDMRRLASLYRGRRSKSVEFFDALGEEWNNVRETLPPPSLYIHTLTSLLRTPGALLEIGVGTGHIIPLLSRIGGRVTGVDNSPEMLSAAEKKAAALGLSDRVEFRLGEAEHLPLGDSSVDRVLMHFMLHHAGNPRDAVMEAARVLKESGSLVIVEFTGDPATPNLGRHGDLWPGFSRDELEMWGTEGGLIPGYEEELEEHSMIIFSMVKGGSNGLRD